MKKNKKEGNRNTMRKTILIIEIAVVISCIAFFSWQAIMLRKNLQEKMDTLDMMISKYEAKARFIEDYLPIVNLYTDSEIAARRILSAVYENSIQYNLSPELILSVIMVESEFNPRAYSDAGAIGLMQIMPVTGIYVGRSLGLWIGNDEDLYEIEKNIQIGVVFLKECIERLGEKRGLGYYYAGRYTQHYREYTKKIAAAHKFWETDVTPVSYTVQNELN